MQPPRRQYSPKNHGNRKYGAEDAARWRRIMREERISQEKLAKREGVGRTTINKILQEF